MSLKNTFLNNSCVDGGFSGMTEVWYTSTRFSSQAVTEKPETL